MLKIFAKAALLTIALVAVTSADAQTRRQPAQREVTPAVPPPSADKRDSVVAALGPLNGKPYWLALAQCGGAYFKLNVLYTDLATHARIKPDPRAATEYTRKLTDAIKIGTIYFNGAERFLMADRGIERVDAVLTYDPQSRVAEDRLKTVEAAEAAAQACPTLYEACRAAYPKACSERLPPTR
jgi:ferredoxin